MRLAKVYKQDIHCLKRFCMYETVYRSHTILNISVVPAKEFNTRYTSNNRLTRKGSLDTQP